MLFLTILLLNTISVLSESFNVSLSLEVTGNSFECDRGLTNSGEVYLQYRQIEEDSLTYRQIEDSLTSPWHNIGNLSSNHEGTSPERLSFNFTHHLEWQSAQQQFLQFRLLQTEHGGGMCNCWRVVAHTWTVEWNDSFSRVTLEECESTGRLSSSLTYFDQTTHPWLCQGSASVARAVISNVVSLLYPGKRMSCQNSATEEVVPSTTAQPVVDNCINNDRFVLSFEIIMFSSTSIYGSLSGADTGIEVAIRGEKDSLDQWIPIKYFHASFDRQEPIKVGMFDSSDTSGDSHFIIRGYRVSAKILQFPKTVVYIEICGGDQFWRRDNIQLRWLQTARFQQYSDIKHVWGLNNVKVCVLNGSISSSLEQDNVESRNCGFKESSGCRVCNESIERTGNDYVVVSRSATAKWNLSYANQSDCEYEYATRPTTTVGPTPMVSTTERILNNSLPISHQVEALRRLTMQILLHQNYPQDDVALVKEIINLVSTIITEAQNQSGILTQSSSSSSLGSIILDIMDQLALSLLGSVKIISDNIELQVERYNESFEVELGSLGPTSRYSIAVPQELVSMFAGNPGNEDGIRTFSYLYRNINPLFMANISDVVSLALVCGNEICRTSNLSLSSNVTITISHEEYDEKQETSCTFWNFNDSSGAADAIRDSGSWSGMGCSKNTTLSTSKLTVCECSHLTHFAILLSANPPNLTNPVRESLMYIGYIGVSISLVAMFLTIFTFIAFKSLHSMRNYIHVNLCISLAVAQLTFIAGVDKNSNTDNVPIHCQVIAVLLHYFFLVSFMWMLMEGVVLYVALVRVFVKHKKRYMVAFTVASYGLPLLYMGLITLPLGFALPNGSYYGYENTCFLRGKEFVWALICPVILIFLANTGFIIMASKIMWHHQMKLKENTKFRNVRAWLKSAVSLMVIMGLTWVCGLLLVSESLVFLIYLFTILVALQGLFIFLVFVVFSKTVREAYIKWVKVKVNESSFLSRHFGELTYPKLTRSFGKNNDTKDNINNGISDKGLTTVATQQTSNLYQMVPSLSSSTAYSGAALKLPMTENDAGTDPIDYSQQHPSDAESCFVKQNQTEDSDSDMPLNSECLKDDTCCIDENPTLESADSKQYHVEVQKSDYSAIDQCQVGVDDSEGEKSPLPYTCPDANFKSQRKLESIEPDKDNVEISIDEDMEDIHCQSFSIQFD